MNFLFIKESWKKVNHGFHKTFIYLFVYLHIVQKYWLKIAEIIYFKKQQNALPANLNIWVEVILPSCYVPEVGKYVFRVQQKAFIIKWFLIILTHSGTNCSFSWESPSHFGCSISLFTWNASQALDLDETYICQGILEQPLRKSYEILFHITAEHATFYSKC